MIPTIALVLLSAVGLHAWSGILITETGEGHLYIPGNPTINMSNIDFELSEYVHSQAAVVFNGSVYLTGGETRKGTSNGVTLFDPATNQTTTGPPLNKARDAHAASVVNSTIVVCGGYNGRLVDATCEQYNATTKEWTVITSLPVNISYMVMITLNNRLYTFGGVLPTQSTTQPVYMFDGQSWQTMLSVYSLPSQGHAGVALDNDRALICGGLKIGESKKTSDCLVYSASSDSWTQAAPMMTKSSYNSVLSMVVFNGLLYILELRKYTFYR
jgi:hypothetical protein